MILKEQATLINTILNTITQELYENVQIIDEEPVSVPNSDYDLQFFVTDSFQKFDSSFTINDKKYIPVVVRRLDPFVPKSTNGVSIDYLELEIYAPLEHKEAVETILNEYQTRYHAVNQAYSGSFYVQYIGKQVYEEKEKSVDGDLEEYVKSYLRVEWDTILDGVHFDQTSISIGGTIYPVKVQTYRNNKSTIGNKPYNGENNEDIKLVSEELIITVPLNDVTASSSLWQDIHSATYNKTYTIVDTYGASTTITKDWELKSGIVQKEENKIVSFTCVFDIPLPRAVVTITHKPLVGTPTTGELVIVNFSEGGTNSLDARMKDKLVKANELRQGNAYSISFIYEVGNEIAKILAQRCHRKVEGDRWDITYTFEDLSFAYTDLVLESGSHAWVDNPGMAFTCNFVEGL